MKTLMAFLAFLAFALIGLGIALTVNPEILQVSWSLSDYYYSEQSVYIEEPFSDLTIQMDQKVINIIGTTDDQLHLVYWDAVNDPLLWEIQHGKLTISQETTSFLQFIGDTFYESKPREISIYVPNNMIDELHVSLNEGNLFIARVDVGSELSIEAIEAMIDIYMMNLPILTINAVGSTISLDTVTVVDQHTVTGQAVDYTAISSQLSDATFNFPTGEVYLDEVDVDSIDIDMSVEGEFIANMLAVTTSLTCSLEYGSVMLLLNQSVNSIDHVQITSDGMIHFNEIINFDIYTADLS